VSSVPSYESVNLLRLAKNKKALDEDEYRDLKKEVFESGKDAGDLRKSITGMMRQREEIDPVEARRKKKTAVLKRLVATLKSLKTDIEHSKMLPIAILKDTVSLIAKIEAEIE
jgi:predicted  nucleic acid-binding Zn-ribbon protein